MDGSPAKSPTTRPRGYAPLAARLLLGVLALAAALAGVLLLWLGPRTAKSFELLGGDFLREGSTAIRELAHDQSLQMHDLLVDVLRASATDRERALAKLPLDALAGDPSALRDAIAADDARRSAHERQNVVALGAARRTNVEASIDARLRALAAAQAARTRQFVADQRLGHLLLVAAALVATLAALGVGLHRHVVAPAERLRSAAQRVAAGDLTPLLPPPPRDELGLLAHDFAAMTAQLRAAKADQERFADDLARQVADKTAHLERALADLQASHAQLAQAERLAALGTLAGGVAHEFHNVIGGIRGCAADLAADEADAGRRETLAVIQRAADRATAIVRELQRFARRSLDRRAACDVARVLDDALRLCEPAARRQGVAIERDVAAGLALHGDADGLHQVFVNLLVNALQAMPEGGTLRVAAARRGDDVVVQVADTGHGIAAEHLPHVFEPFFTTKGDTREPGQGGSGLGLAVSYGIVAAHRGRIEAASPPGAGATFTVRLPVAGADS
jgi:signal transduction histidine kinase